MLHFFWCKRCPSVNGKRACHAVKLLGRFCGLLLRWPAVLFYCLPACARFRLIHRRTTPLLTFVQRAIRVRSAGNEQEEYKRRHDEIWPEMVAAIRESGFRNHGLFRRGRQVIAYAECHPDASTAFAAMASREVSARWAAWSAGDT